VIAIVGRLAGRSGDDEGVAGRAGEIAVAAAGRGARVELVAKIGDDPAGDRLLLALTRARVGHAAILRDPARPTPVAAAPVGASGPGAADDASADDDAPADLIVSNAPSPAGATVTAADDGLQLAAGDLELALRYLTDASVIVFADAASELLPVAVEGAGFAGAALVIVGDPAAVSAGDAPAATVLAPPADDPDGAFAALVAEYAVELDAGRDPADAWAAATRRIGAEPA
jgi:hypothetical protein